MPDEPFTTAAPQVVVEREITHRVHCGRCGYVGSRQDEYDALRLREAHLRDDHAVAGITSEPARSVRRD